MEELNVIKTGMPFLDELLGGGLLVQLSSFSNSQVLNFGSWSIAYCTIIIMINFT